MAFSVSVPVLLRTELGAPCIGQPNPRVAVVYGSHSLHFDGLGIRVAIGALAFSVYYCDCRTMRKSLFLSPLTGGKD